MAYVAYTQAAKARTKLQALAESLVFPFTYLLKVINGNLHLSRIINSTKISRRNFYANGGFSNPRHYRRGTRQGWTYWRLE